MAVSFDAMREEKKKEERKDAREEGKRVVHNIFSLK